MPYHLATPHHRVSRIRPAPDSTSGWQWPRAIGGLAMSLPRLDAVIFTGGIGENSPMIRRDTVARLGAFGATLDADANEKTIRGRRGLISRSGPRIAVVATNEEWVIARDTRSVIGLDRS